ncbi:Glycosyltransferase [Rhynchospora pubera]|uniref:Glycosyltransferase n=1 Tax=Rhynchospora pubera TaxID=906938 RepID=A0AAV8F2F5_9POAL|nr:Glycosyltransferase [Rhynchospora pubera]
MKKAKVVLYPVIGVSHMIPMIQLAKSFINHSISIDIAVLNPPTMPVATSKLISKVSSTDPQISFTLLPVMLPSPNPTSTLFENMINMIRSNNIKLQSYLQSEMETSSIAALVMDFFCADALDVAHELGIPAYIFFPTGANNLAVFLHLPELASTWDRTKENVGKTPIVINGVPLIHASDLPREVLEISDDHELFINVFRRMRKANGILMNTFESLEPRAVKSLMDEFSLPTGPAPPTYCIGPLVTAPDKEVTHPCLRWLDAQPKKSVVYVSFGSSGKFSIEKLTEIAFGIEKSGHKFLWVVRNPPNDDPKEPYDPLAEPDLDALLPEGFLDRTKEQGIVVKSWAPQVEVLNHDSIGGFVSHCGWSSILEAVINGVPIICWPLFAEQRMNRVFLAEEMKIGVELKGSDEGMVSGDELAEKVRWLMESEGGQELRNNVNAHRINGMAALREKGSSETAFLEFIGNLKL